MTDNEFIEKWKKIIDELKILSDQDFDMICSLFIRERVIRDEKSLKNLGFTRRDPTEEDYERINRELGIRTVYISED